MAKDKKSFILYCDQRGIFNKLSDEQAGVLIKHIFAYVSDENPNADFVTELAFESIKTQLKRDLQKYEQIKDKRSEAGKASAEKRKQTSTNPTSVESAEQTSTNPTVNDIVNVNDNDNVNEISLTEKQGSDLLLTDFDIFWKAYDYNVGLRQTQDEWLKIKREMPNEIDKILVHVPLYVVSKPDKSYRKKPENYLKERTWKDEIVTRNSKQPPSKDVPIIWDDQSIKDYIENPFISQEAKDAFMQERMREATNRIKLDIPNTKQLNQ